MDTKLVKMISVVIPVYNASRYILKALRSILNQTYGDLELLICDDCSEDDSLQKIESIRDKRIRIFRNPVNMGYLKTINLLFSKVESEIVAFQDADDYSHPDRFQKQINCIINNPELALVGTGYAVVDTRDKIVRNGVVESDPEIIGKKLPDGNVFQKPSIMFKSEVLDVIGGFREEFLELGNISEDYDWLLRASHQFKMGNVNYKEPLYYYRSVNTAMTKGFNNPLQFLGEEVAKYLYRQRIALGVDSIDKGDLEEIKSLIENLKKPFLKDPSLFYRRKAETLMFSGLKQMALLNSLIAFRKKPGLKNLRLIQHCLRKIILRF